MEAEINKLKELYLKTNTPDFLDTHGVEDVFKRINSPSPVSHFYFSRYAQIVCVICFVLVGVFGTAAASSQPKSTLYPVKQFVQKITSAAVHLTPHETENSVKTILLKQQTPSPTLTPALSTTPTPTPKLEKHEDERKNTQHEDEHEDTEDINGNLIFPTQTPIPHHEDVQGASTSRSENNNSNEANNTNKNAAANTNENKQQNSGNSTGSNNGNSDHGNNSNKDN